MSMYPAIQDALATVAVGGGAAFFRTLRIGDSGQIEVMRAINGQALFCCVCFTRREITGPQRIHLKGSKCKEPGCSGYFVTAEYWESIQDRSQRERKTP